MNIPIFEVTGGFLTMGPDGETQQVPGQLSTGVTLRDLFAMQAMAALVNAGMTNIQRVGKDSYGIADRMLAARNEVPEVKNADS